MQPAESHMLTAPTTSSKEMAGGVQIVSRHMVRPESSVSSKKLQEPEIMHLTPWDLRLITVEYIQKGILLPKPLSGGANLADDLASSLARALDRFYPLAGRLTVLAAGDVGQLAISLCCNGEGAEFVHAVAPEVTASDITASLYVPSVVWSLFPLNGVLGTDAVLDSRPLLAAQVTELADGVFVAMSLHHGVADGTTFWHLFNTWAEINRRGGGEGCSSYELLATPPPVLDRWFLDSCPVPIPLPFGKVEDMVRRPVYAPVAECFFHFSADNVRKLKAKANAEMAGTATATISSLQSLLAHVWRAACRARGLAPHRETSYTLLVGCRARLNGIPQGYTGNAVTMALASSTAGEVEEKGLGWAAWLLNRAVASFDEARVRDGLASWAEEPSFLYVDELAKKIVTGSSPRFDVYGNDFGWGGPVAVRSGAGNKVDGKVTVYQGRGGGGSMALEVCLSHDALARLVADEEFMEVVSAE